MFALRGFFPTRKKKSFILFQFTRKKVCQNISNSKPVFLLPVLSILLKRLIQCHVSVSFLDNEFISPNQSVFKPGDSCVSQLIPTSHEIWKVFNDVLELRGMYTVFDCEVETFVVANTFAFLSFFFSTAILENILENILDKFTKLSKIGFFME